MIILLSTEILFQPVDILNYKRENKKQNNDITLNEYTVKVFKLPVYKQYKDDLLWVYTECLWCCNLWDKRGEEKERAWHEYKLGAGPYPQLETGWHTEDRLHSWFYI